MFDSTKPTVVEQGSNTNVLWLFLTVSWVGLQCVIVVFTDHTDLLYEQSNANTVITDHSALINVHESTYLFAIAYGLKKIKKLVVKSQIV